MTKLFGVAHKALAENLLCRGDDGEGIRVGVRDDIGKLRVELGANGAENDLAILLEIAADAVQKRDADGKLVHQAIAKLVGCFGNDEDKAVLHGAVKHHIHRLGADDECKRGVERGFKRTKYDCRRQNHGDVDHKKEKSLSDVRKFKTKQSNADVGAARGAAAAEHKPESDAAKHATKERGKNGIVGQGQIRYVLVEQA